MTREAFILVHRGAPSKQKASSDLVSLTRAIPIIKPLMDSIPKKYEMFKRVVARNLATIDSKSLPNVLPAFKRTAQILSAQRGAKVIGVWDLGSRLARMQELLSRLNLSQEKLVFFEIEAAIPIGMVSQPEKVIRWASVAFERVLDASETQQFARNIIASDFYPRANLIRRSLGLDLLVGVTPALVADIDDGEVFWNHFSSYEGPTVLTSSADLRRFAMEARCHVEVLAGMIILSQVLTALYSHRGVGFHRETRGCLFDYNEDRSGLIECSADIKIEEDCIKLFPPAFRQVALSLADALNMWARGK